MLWSRLPLLKFLLALMAGVWLADLSISFDIRPYILGLLLVSLIILAFNSSVSQKGIKRSLPFHILFLLLAYELTTYQLSTDREFSPTERAEAYLVEVETVLNSTDYYHKYIVSLEAEMADSQWQPRSALLLLKQKRTDAQAFLPADQLLLKGNCDPIRGAVNPEQFDYADYLKYQHVHLQLRSEVELQIDSSNSIQRTAFKIRSELIEAFQNSKMKEENLAVLLAILLGDKSELDSELRDDFSRAGAMHVLAVSGLHLGIVFLLFDQLLSLFRLRKSSWIRAILLWTVLWSFALLTGMSNSVMRSALMFSLFTLGSLLSRKGSSLNSVAASAIILLLLDPLRLFQLGFQLSYSAVFGILLIYPPLAKVCRQKSKMLNKVIDLLLISIAAQISTLPLTLAYFHQFPNFFLLTNLFVIPLAFIIVGAGVIISILLFSTGTALGLDVILDLALDFLRFAVNWVAGNQWSVWEGIWLEDASIMLLLLALLLAIGYLQSRRSRLLIYSAVCMFSLGVIENIHLLRSADQKQLTVYSANPLKVISFRSGFSAHLLRLDSLNAFEEAMINDHLDALHVREVKTTTYSLAQFKADSMMRVKFFGDQLMVLPGSEIPIYPKLDAMASKLIFNGLVWNPYQDEDMKGMQAIGFSYSDRIDSLGLYNLKDSAYIQRY